LKPPVAGFAGGVRRPGVAVAAKPAVAESKGLTVTSQSKKDEIGIQTLVGDYEETSSNHEKKVYKKKQKIAGHEDVNVFLYYWDQRDGADFSGWWFGDQVGGSQVWARAVSHGPAPPRIGWKIPWDSPKAEPGVLFVDPRAAAPAAGAAAPPAAAAVPTGPVKTAEELEEIVAKAGEQVETQETSSKEAVEASKALDAASDTTELQEVVAALQKEQTACMEAQKSLTKDIGEAKRGGISATPKVTELSKLSPRIRSLQASLSAELVRVKAFVTKSQMTEAQKKKAAETAEANKEVEERDTKILEEELPAMQELVSTAEESADAVVTMSAPLIAEPPDDDDEMLKKSIEEIEAAATEAQTKIGDARNQINTKLTAARKFAPETRKNALAEFSGMQTKLTEAQKKVAPYKNFKKEFKARVEARKSLQDTADKLNNFELEVEKLKMMSSGAAEGLMSDEELTQAEKISQPAKAGVENIIRTLQQKMIAAAGAVKDELSQMKDRASEIKKAMDEVLLLLKKNRESVATKSMLKQAAEKVDKVEECMEQCGQAELPWLKGVEVLPKDESEKALKECAVASTAVDGALTQARTFIKTKLAEAKKLVKEVQADVTEELNSHSSRLEEVAKRVGEFKKDMNERRVAAILAEAVDAISACDKKIEVLVKVSQVFSSDLEEVSTDTLKEAVEKTAAAEKEAAAALMEARKVFASKQQQAKGLDQAALTKLQGRMNNAQAEITKAKRVSATAEKMIKGKEVLNQEDEKIKKIETDVDEAEKKVKPSEDAIALGIEETKCSDEEIESMSTMLFESQKTLQSSTKLVEATVIGSPPALQTSLKKLTERSKATLKKITEVLAVTKDQRERVMSEAFVKQGKEKVDEVEQALEKGNEAELPFLKGIEVAAGESANVIAACEAAAKATNDAITAARSFVAGKSLELKKFGEAASKPANAEFVQLTERINSAAAKLGEFKKETDTRKKTARVQEAVDKTTKAEEEMKTLGELIEPFANKEAGSEPAEEECEKLVNQLKAAQALVEELRTALAGLQRDLKGVAAHADTLKDIQTRLTPLQADLMKHKKIASVHEQKFMAKKLLIEVGEQVDAMETEVQKCVEFCAPLVEQGGEKYLVQASIRTLADALRDYMTKKDSTQEALFKEIADGKDTVTQEAFLAFMEKFPEASGHEEVEFVPARRSAMYEQIVDGDISMSLAGFQAIFKQCFNCVKEISVTDLFDMGKSKTIAKVAAGGHLATEHGAKVDESGMTRIECTVVATGKTGFVTMQGNSGTKFLDLVSPFAIYCTDMDKTIDETLKSCAKVAAFINAKTKDMGVASKGSPGADAREELNKLRGKVVAAQGSLNTLKTKGVNAKRLFKQKEIDEKNAHVVAKEQKAADELLAPAVAKAESATADAKALEEAAKPLTSVSGKDLEAFATPITVLEEAEKLIASIRTKVEDAKKAITEQQADLPKAVKGPMLEAKKEFAKMAGTMEATLKKSTNIMVNISKNCGIIADKFSTSVSGLMRAEMQKKGITVEAYFSELASGGERITEDAFTNYVKGLQGEAFAAQPVTMVCRSIDTGGIGKRRFQSFMQQYYVVVKGIAITDAFDIGAAKTIRKVELQEVIELLEGPKATDDEAALQRVRGRSLKDGTEGWVTLKGNQGTPYLQEVEKPHYYCKADVPLEREFKSEGEAGVLRTLKVDEVLELLEGPKKETYEPALRVKGKASKDEALGWFTVRDKTGTVFAEADGKYYTCTASVAMTDNRDIKECKVLRKLQKDELFLVEDKPVEEEGSGITRVLGKTLKDELTGWVTLKGNAGTAYAEPSTKHYCVLRDVPLTKKFPSKEPGEEVRVLSKGEALLALEGPKSETFAAEVRIKVKAVSDNQAGWITLKTEALKPWTPFYKCKTATPVTETPSSEGATVVRQAAVNEGFELMEGPSTEGGELRMKARSEQDGTVGWVTIKDSDGKRLFEVK